MIEDSVRLKHITAIGVIDAKCCFCGKIIADWNERENTFSVELCDFKNGKCLTTCFDVPDLNGALEGFRFQDFVLTYDYERSFREHGFKLFKVMV